MTRNLYDNFDFDDDEIKEQYTRMVFKDGKQENEIGKFRNLNDLKSVS